MTQDRCITYLCTPYPIQNLCAFPVTNITIHFRSLYRFRPPQSVLFAERLVTCRARCRKLRVIDSIQVSSHPRRQIILADWRERMEGGGSLNAFNWIGCLGTIRRASSHLTSPFLSLSALLIAGFSRQATMRLHTLD